MNVGALSLLLLTAAVEDEVDDKEDVQKPRAAQATSGF